MKTERRVSPLSALRPFVATLSIFSLVGSLAACTPNKRRPPKEEPAAEKAEPVPVAAEAKPLTVAVTPFVGTDGKAGWLGVLLADHITRRLHVESSSDEPPLYVLGWRQAMSAGRSIDLDGEDYAAGASSLLVELGVDEVIVGTHELKDDSIVIRWKIIGTDGEVQSGEASGATGAAARTAYALGGELLKALAPDVSASDDDMDELAAVGAGEAWGKALLAMSAQSRDPRATVVLDSEEIDEVLSLLESVTQSAGDFAPAWAMRATVASMGYEPQEEIAMSSAKAASNVGAADPSAAISLYYMHQQLAEQTRARQMLEQALATYPGSLEVLNYLAQAYYLAGDFEKTYDVWIQYLKIAPKSAHAARRRNRMLSRLGRHDEAIREAEALVEEHPGSVPTIAALASRQIDAKKLDAAQATLEAALEEHPNHPLLLTRLSFVQLERGSSKRALALAKKAVSLIGDGRGEPLAGYAHIDLARAQALNGDRATAKKTLRQALRLGVGGDDIVRLANDPRLEGFITLPLVLEPE